MADTHVPDDVYERLHQHFTKKALADSTLAVAATGTGWRSTCAPNRGRIIRRSCMRRLPHSSRQPLIDADFREFLELILSVLIRENPWQVLLKMKSLPHQSLQAGAIENVVGEFFVGEHGEGRALGAGTQL